MAKTFRILKITPTSNLEAGSITIEGDWTKAFTGAFFLDENTNTQHPFYKDPPVSTRRIDPTSFKVVGNERFSGKYTVRTPKSAADIERDRFLDEHGNTVIRVNELIKPLGDTEDETILTYGSIVNVTTFIIEIPGSPDELLFIYPKSLSKVLYLDLPGHGYENWGEIYTQNLVDFMFNHATFEQPRSARPGQLWFDRNTEQLKIWAGNQWMICTAEPPKPISYLHVQTDDDTEWVVQHNLEIPSPHIATVQVYVDRGYGPETAAPSKVTFSNRNLLQVTFSEPIKGWVKVTL